MKSHKTGSCTSSNTVAELPTAKLFAANAEPVLAEVYTEKPVATEPEDDEIKLSRITWAVHTESISIERAVYLEAYGKTFTKRLVTAPQESVRTEPYPLEVVKRKFKECAYRISSAYIDFPAQIKLWVAFDVGGYVYPETLLVLGFDKNGPSDEFGATPPCSLCRCDHYFTPMGYTMDHRIRAIRQAFARAVSDGYPEYGVYCCYLETAILRHVATKGFEATCIYPRGSASRPYCWYVETIRGLIELYPEHTKSYMTAIALLQRIA